MSTTERVRNFSEPSAVSGAVAHKRAEGSPIPPDRIYIEAIIFDFFGVLSTEVAPGWFAKFMPDNAHELKEKYMQPADMGTVSQEELFQQLSEFTGIPATDIEADWMRRVHPNTALIDLINTRLTGYKLGILSNAMGRFFRTVTAPMELEKTFSTIVVSSEIGHAKPAPEAFAVALSELSVAADKTLFVDDNRINVDEAKRIGMRALQYGSFEKFTEDLAAMGLL